jgi:hypothetical protein
MTPPVNQGAHAATILNVLCLLRQQRIYMSDNSMATAWLLLLHFLPTSKAQARVQTWRRLQRAGAVSLKNSAYALPNSPESREDFEWIRNEVITAGGQAIVLVAQTLDQAALDDVRSAFRAARAADFRAIAEQARALLKRAAGRQPTARRALTQRLRRLRERYDETVRLDFLHVEQRDHAAALLDQLDQRTGRRPPMPEATASTPLDSAQYHGRTWITRPRPGVDRMSSAWLIQRFIDPKAQFAFGEAKSDAKAIPFDTFEAEFGHRGRHCTFETLCERFGIRDAAVQRVARIVHDLDFKEATYGESEGPTMGRLVAGLRRAHADDGALLRAGMDMFEALYQSMTGDTKRTRSGTASREKKRGSSRTRNSSP